MLNKPKGTVVKKTQCPTCQDSGQDNLVHYSDGSTFCYACWKPMNKSKFIDYNIQALRTRGITEETCRQFDYGVGKYTGKMGKDQVKDLWVQVANYKNDLGATIAQKLRGPTDEETGKKPFIIVGAAKERELYGQWKWNPNEKLFITVVEGEIDCLTVAQVQGYQYPVVSINNGAGGAYECIKQNLKYLLGFKYVVLAFDNDEDGRKATQECLSLFEPGKVKIAEWPLKDANELLMQGRSEEIRDTIFNAKQYTPKNLVTVKDVLKKVLQQPQMGLDWPWPSMTKATYGLQFNEISVIVGPAGCGKTEVIKDIVSHFIDSFPVGVFSFEQSPEDTIRRYVGAKISRKLQVPGEVWEADKIKDTALLYDEKLWLYDFDGEVSIDELFNCIRYLAKAKGCKLFVIDNLKSLKIVFNKEEVAKFSTRLRALTKELNIHVILVSHVSKDTIRSSTHVGFSSKVKEPHANLSEDFIKETLNKFKLDWENGRMPTSGNIEGGNDIEAIANYVFALGRNKISDNERERRIINVKMLKCGRIDSEHSAMTWSLYRQDNGTLVELDNNPFKEGEVDKEAF